MSWYRYRVRRKRRTTVTKHYLEHKETARAMLVARAEYWSGITGYSYNRIAIRNQRYRWGSCTDRGNLNFNYKLIFLPAHITDYIIVHELCHLKELNHGRRFWQLVEEVIPDYRLHIRELREIEKMGWTAYMKSLVELEKERTTVFMMPECERCEGAVG